MVKPKGNIISIPKLLSKPMEKLGRVVLPGFEGMPLGVVVHHLIKTFKNTRIFDRAGATTYFFFMAFPPTLLFLFTLFPYLPMKGLQDAVLRTLVFVIPDPNTYHSVATVLDNFLNKERTDLLSFGVILALYFSSNGMMSLMRAFDRSLPFYVFRSGIRRRLTAIKLTLMVMLSFIGTVVALVIQSNAIDKYLHKITTSPSATKFLSLIIILMLVFITISAIFRYGPSFKKRVRFFSVGSVFATIFFALITFGFFFLVTNFLNYDVVYGPIGSLIALMIWLYWINIVLLVGYEINVSILMSKHKFLYKGKAMTKQENQQPTPGDIVVNMPSEQVNTEQSDKNNTTT